MPMVMYTKVWRSKVPGAGKAELVFTGEDGTEIRETIHDFDGPGVIQGMHNIDASIASFARSCFTYALDTKQDLWFATKARSLRNTITHSKISSRRSLMQNTKRNLMQQESNISTH